MSDGDDLRLYAEEQRRRIEQTLINYEQATDGSAREVADHLVKLKTRLNSLVHINRLPVELLPIIIRFTNPSYIKEWSQYIPYTSVCRHWRSVLIQTPDLWTSVDLSDDDQKPINEFIFREFLGRTKSAKLDVTIFNSSCTITAAFLSIVEALARESHRIHALRIDGLRTDEIELAFQLVLQDKRFPSLKKFLYYDNQWTRNSGLNILIPIIITSDHLETFGFKLPRNTGADSINQLTLVFSRTIRKLCLDFPNPKFLQFVLSLLHNNTKLQNLRLIVFFDTPLDLSGQTLLPELQFLACDTRIPSLLKVVRAPKLSSFDLSWYSSVNLNMDYPIFEKFHFASIKYLYIMDRLELSDDDPVTYPFSILGLKELIHSKLVFSAESGVGETQFIREVENIANDSLNFASDVWPRGVFRFQFFSQKTFVRVVKEPSCLRLPRLIGLSEICLVSRTVLGDKEFHLDEFLSQVPSLQKLTVLYGDGLMAFIHLLTNNTSICPRLEHLSYMESEEVALKCLDVEKIGEILTECVQTRRKIHTGALKYITLGRCPPLLDTVVRELQTLGTTVVTHAKKDVDHVRSDEAH